jgi:[acyl-carrier-protein] S-malonyltransferase
MGATRFVELGPGRVLSGLVRRVRRDAPTAQVGSPEDLEALRTLLDAGAGSLPVR